MEKKVVECGKTALAVPINLLQSETDFFARNYPTAKFYRSRDILQPEPNGIALKNPGISRIPFYYKSLIETGIYGRLNTEFYARKNFRRKGAGEKKILSNKKTMDGGISTLFIICAGLTGLGFFVFCVEYLKRTVITAVIKCFKRKIFYKMKVRVMNFNQN